MGSRLSSLLPFSHSQGGSANQNSNGPMNYDQEQVFHIPEGTSMRVSTGCFADKFNFGGEEYAAMKPFGSDNDVSLFLFGEEEELRFLKMNSDELATNFPFKLTEKNDLLGVVDCLINIRRDSIQLHIKEDEDFEGQFSVQADFVIDTDVPVTIEMFGGMEQLVTTVDQTVLNNTMHIPVGANQHVSNKASPLKYRFDDNSENEHDSDKRYFCIKCVEVLSEADKLVNRCPQQQLMVCAITIESLHPDVKFSNKVYCQQQLIDQVPFIIHEIFGIEQKLNLRRMTMVEPPVNRSNRSGGSTADAVIDPNEEEDDEDEDDSDSNECVVCMSEYRDTVILPCRHLCLCQTCAYSLRHQSADCPICRVPFKALLQIRAIAANNPLATHEDHATDDSNANDGVVLPAGYHCVPLLKALNGYRNKKTKTTIAYRPINKDRLEPRGVCGAGDDEDEDEDDIGVDDDTGVAGCGDDSKSAVGAFDRTATCSNKTQDSSTSIDHLLKDSKDVVVSPEAVDTHKTRKQHPLDGEDEEDGVSLVSEKVCVAGDMSEDDGQADVKSPSPAKSTSKADGKVLRATTVL